MANENRVRALGLRGTLSTSLNIGDTSMDAAELAGAPGVDATQHMPITLDPEGTPEVIYVTAHGAGATSATVVRGREGTTEVDHASGVEWKHTPVLSDYPTKVEKTAVALGGAHGTGEAVYTWVEVTNVCIRGLLSLFSITSSASGNLYDLQVRSAAAGGGSLFLEAINVDADYTITAPVYIEGNLDRSVWVGIKNKHTVARTFTLAALRVERYA